MRKIVCLTEILEKSELLCKIQFWYTSEKCVKNKVVNKMKDIVVVMKN